MHFSAARYLSSNSSAREGSIPSAANNKPIVGDADAISSSLEESNTRGTFFGHTLCQMVDNPTARLAYRDSNRGAVALGLAGGLVGAPFGATLLGVTAGSSVGAHAGTAFRMVKEGVRSLEHPLNEGEFKLIEMIPLSLGSREGAVENDEADKGALTTSVEPPLHVTEAEEKSLFHHVVEVVDHAGHYGAVASIATAVVVSVASLAVGNPLPVVAHTAGVCSGAAWGFGLVTGASHWLLTLSGRQSPRLLNAE